MYRLHSQSIFIARHFCLSEVKRDENLLRGNFLFYEAEDTYHRVVEMKSYYNLTTFISRILDPYLDNERI